MQSTSRTTVVLGTGGTIAGTAEDAKDNVGYKAAQVGVAQLLTGWNARNNLPILL